MIKALRTSTAIVMAGCLAVPLYAQLAPDAGAVRALSSARSLKCSFPWYSSADWNEDRPTLKNATQTDFGFHIDGIDYGKGVARLIGNAGAEDLTPVRGDSSVSFIERVPVGTLNVTTVLCVAQQGRPFQSGPLAPYGYRRPESIAELRIL
jgi:hypothetical protein